MLLGEGAAWVGERGRVNFPSAPQLLDSYPAREHRPRLAEARAGKDTPAAAKLPKKWARLRWAGKVPRWLKTARQRAWPQATESSAAGATELGDFEKHPFRRRDSRFRTQGRFLGSGGVEAGCKTVGAPRAQQSGRCGSESGLLAVRHTRGAWRSRRFEAFGQNDNPAEQSAA